MQLEHLRCGVMHPRAGGTMTCHVFLLHTDSGLVLVDTAFGTADVKDPSRLGPFGQELRIEQDRAYTVLAQLETRGFSADDVQHIVMTHLDGDHAGGLPDFPHAIVHTTAAEHAAAMAREGLQELRYRPEQWAHGPRFQLHEGPGDPWRDGLRGIEVLPGVTFVPMPGHTLGHAAVAVEVDGQLVVHAGDALYDASEVGHDLEPAPGLREFEQFLAIDRDSIAHNHEALRGLVDTGALVVPAHDPRLTRSLAS